MLLVFKPSLLISLEIITPELIISTYCITLYDTRLHIRVLDHYLEKEKNDCK